MNIILAILITVSFLTPLNAAEETSQKTETVAKSKSKKSARKSAKKKAQEVPAEKEWSVEPLETSSEQGKEQAGDVIAPEVRELIILRAGAQKYIGHWDEVEKDALLELIKNQPLSDVAQKYNMIPSKILRNLKKELP